MKTKDRLNYLKRAPILFRDILFRGHYQFTYDLMPVHIAGMSMKKRLNLLKSALNLIYRRPTPSSWPIFMQIELTNYCNLECPVCPTGIGKLKRKPQAIAPGLFERLMDEVGEYLLVMALWAWGESLLHPDLGKILRMAKKCNVATLISTNGQNLNSHKVLHSLLEAPPSCLIVAIDGLTEKTNSLFRKGARLATVLEGVSRLAELKKQRRQSEPLLHMRFMVMKHNEHEVFQLEQFARANQFDLLSIRTLSIIDSSEEPHRNLVPQSGAYRAYDYKDNRRVRRDDFICQLPFISPTVFADGTVVACEQDFNAQQPLGVVSNNVAFADVWFGNKAQKVRGLIKNNPEKLSFCRKCPYADRPLKTCSVQVFDLRQRKI